MDVTPIIVPGLHPGATEASGVQREAKPIKGWPQSRAWLLGVLVQSYLQEIRACNILLVCVYAHAEARGQHKASP